MTLPFHPSAFGGSISAAGGGAFQLLFSTNYPGASGSYLGSSSLNGDRTENIWAFWFRCEELSTSQTFVSAYAASNDNDSGLIVLTNTGQIRLDGWGSIWATSSASYDDGLWHHLIVSIDTSNGTAADRVLLYVDGVEDVASTTDPGSGTSLAWFNSAASHRVGAASVGSPADFKGDMTQLVALSGVSIQQGDYAISDFYDNGPVDVETTLTFASTDIYLSMQDRGHHGRDFSGNDLHFTETGTVEWSRNAPGQWSRIIGHFEGNDTEAFTDDKGRWRVAPTFNGNGQIDTGVTMVGSSTWLGDGNTDAIVYPENGDGLYVIGPSDFFVEMRVRSTSLAASQTLFSKGYVSTGDFLVQVASTTGTITVWHSGSNIVSSSTPISVNTEHHVRVERYNGTVTIWLDGVDVGNVANTTDLSNSAGDFIVGNDTYYPTTNGVVGNIDEVRFGIGWTPNEGASFTAPTDAHTDDDGYGEYITTLFGPVALNADTGNFADYSFRNICVTLNVSEGTFDELRATFEAASTGTFDVDNASVGIRASVDDTTATPVEMLFSASSGFALSATEEITSDWVTLACVAADDFLVIADISSGTQTFRYINTGYDGDYTQASANTYDQQTVSMTPTANRSLIKKLEAKTLAAA